MFGKVIIPLILLLGWHFQADPGVAILEPLPGAAVQGVVTVVATTVIDGFVSAELAFQYAQGDPDAWFPLATMDRPVQAEPIAVWDTTTITDGDYRLRLRVHRSDGSIADAVVDGLRVRNYSAIETSTPSPTPTEAETLVVSTTPERQETPIPTETAAPATEAAVVLEGSGTPTAMPANPTSVTTGDILSSVFRGALVVVVGFGLLGVYHWIRSGARRG